MRRRLFTIVSCLSLLLCLGTGLMWVRSLITPPEALEWTRRIDAARSFHSLAVASGDGCLGVSLYWMDDPSIPIYAWRDMMSRGAPPAFRYNRAGASPANPSAYRAYPGGWYFARFGW